MESLIGYVRRNYFVPVPRVKSYEELNQLLLERLLADEERKAPDGKMTVKEAFEKEKGLLLPFAEIPLPVLYQCPAALQPPQPGKL